MKSFKVILFSAGDQVKTWTTDHVYHIGDRAEFYVNGLEVVIHGTYAVEEIANGSV